MKISNFVVAAALSVSGLLGIASTVGAEGYPHLPGYVQDDYPHLPGYVQDKSVFGL